MSIPRIPNAPCACGCGQIIARMVYNGRIRMFKPGHHKVKDGKPKHSQSAICPNCHKEFVLKGRTKYCSKLCYWNARGFSSVPEMACTRGAEPIDRTIFSVSRSPRIQRLYMLACTDSCARCGWSEYKEILELHHVDGNKRNGKKENLRMLCPNCHNTLHFLEKSGYYSNKENHRRAKEIREALGVPYVGRGLARTTIQEIMDYGVLPR